MTPTPTPRTDRMACKLGFHVAAWKQGKIDVARFTELAEKELDEARTLERELAATKAALAEAVKDKERLDWLEASPYRHVEGDYWDTGNPYWRCQDRKNVNTIACIGPDIRAAIDAAIAQEGRT